MQYFESVVRAVEFIEAHLQSDMTVADVAAVSGLSSWHFQRIFHDVVGETIGSYLRRRRLAQALDELKGGDRKVIDIALDYRFGSPESFSRAFKTEFGFSPQQFRNAQPKVVPFKKPVLSRRQIDYLMHEIEFTPEIREVDATRVVGLPGSCVSPLVERARYMANIPELWKEFVRREPEIPHRIGAIKVGVIEGMLAPAHHIHDDMVDFLACTPVAKVDGLPPGFQSWLIPAGTYAVFHSTGYHEQTQYVIDHVYSTWLPKSDYERADGPEFIWLDHRVSPLHSTESAVAYFLPVRKK